MPETLTLVEEFDITRKLQFPHTFSCTNIFQKKELAYYAFAKNNSEILLITPGGFQANFILAGLSEKHIEYIATNAPTEYKKELLDSFLKKYTLKEIFEIAQSMDEDLGGGATQNQERVKNVIQYISDNRIAFEF